MELVITNLLLQTSPSGHGSALLVFTKFSRAAIHFWPYGDTAQSCSSPLPKEESQTGEAFTRLAEGEFGPTQLLL